MSIILRKSYFLVSAILVGSFFLTGVVFAVDNANIEEVNAVIDYKDGYIEIELKDSDGESGFYQLWNTTDEQDVYDDVADKMRVDEAQLVDLVDFTFEHKNRGDEGGFPFSLIGNIVLQASDKPGNLVAEVKYDRVGLLSIVMEYEETKLVSDYYEEIADELSNIYSVTGSFDADDVGDITEVNIDLEDYGQLLDGFGNESVYQEACEAFAPSDIYEVAVENISALPQLDEITVKWLDGCRYSFKTEAYKIDSDFWKGYLVQETVAKINNTQYRISPAVEYSDIADVIEFKEGNYPADSVPTLAQLQAEKDGQVATPEQDADVNDLRAKLMQLIALLQQMLQLQSFLGR